MLSYIAYEQSFKQKTYFKEGQYLYIYSTFDFFTGKIVCSRMITNFQSCEEKTIGVFHIWFGKPRPPILKLNWLLSI
jgi:hypothetical protein